MSDYISLGEAKARDGLRLVTTRGLPGAWSEAARGVLYVKRIPYARVPFAVGQDNAEVVNWTGINSAPVALYGREPPRDHWTQILMLAERLQPDPPLVPRDEEQRALMFGLSHALLGEDGYVWNFRLRSFESAAAASREGEEGARKYDRNMLERLRRKYAYGRGGDQPVQRLLAILDLFAARLKEQRTAGSRYLVGDTLTAVDIYWAVTSILVVPLPLELCPIPEAMRAGYHEVDPVVLAAADRILIEHRDEIYHRHLELPTRL